MADVIIYSLFSKVKDEFDFSVIISNQNTNLLNICNIQYGKIEAEGL